MLRQTKTADITALSLNAPSAAVRRPPRNVIHNNPPIATSASTSSPASA